MYIPRAMGFGQVVAGVLTLCVLSGCPARDSDVQTGATTHEDAPEPPPPVEPPPPSPPKPSPPAPPAPPSDPAPESDEARWLGTWVSDACGGRKYQRVLVLKKGGVAGGQDNVSPCPKGARCVWSGIVPISGSWKLEGDTLRLALTASGGHQVAPLPGILTWSSGPVSDEAGADCPYRAPSAPPP